MLSYTVGARYMSSTWFVWYPGWSWDSGRRWGSIMVEGLRTSRMSRHCRSPLYNRYVTGRHLPLCYLPREQHHTRQDHLILIGPAFLELLVVRYAYLSGPRESSADIQIALS